MGATSAATAPNKVNVRASLYGSVKLPSGSRAHSAPTAADKSSAPHVKPASRSLTSAYSPSLKIEPGVSVAIGNTSGKRSPSFTRCASRARTESGPSHLGNTSPSGLAAITASRSACAHAVASELMRTKRTSAPSVRPRNSATRLACCHLLRARYGILQIENQRIGADGPRFFHPFRAIARNEEQRTQPHAGALRISAIRKHWQTISSRWLSSSMAKGDDAGSWAWTARLAFQRPRFRHASCRR